MAFAGALVPWSAGADVADTRPIVYLTFDDGPSADGVTDEILDLLAQYGAKATFFVTGQRVRHNGSKIPEIMYGGHAIGNHTYSHVNLRNTSSEEVVKELKAAGDEISRAGGPPLTCFRPPFGATDNRVNSISAELGMTPVAWSLDTRDWQPSVFSLEIFETLDRSRDGSVVLMHDGPAKRSKTLVALADWMAVAAHRYQFRALPECQSYGAGEQFALLDDQELDLNVEPETLQSLLLKLQSYRFVLQSEAAREETPVLGGVQQLTAKLDVR